MDGLPHACQPSPGRTPPMHGMRDKGGGGQGGIRTLGTGLGYTRFPGVLIRPL